ncbi:MAG: hypothetical protein V4675_00410 [Verrucomicrobiota bacterium]
MRIPSLAFLLALCMAAPACRSNNPQSAPASSPGGLSFTGRRPDGREIALSNRTKWSIQPAGASATLRWQPGEPVQLGASGQPVWPAAITSRVSGATAFARPAGRF